MSDLYHNTMKFRNEDVARSVFDMMSDRKTVNGHPTFYGLKFNEDGSVYYMSEDFDNIKDLIEISKKFPDESIKLNSYSEFDDYDETSVLKNGEFVENTHSHRDELLAKYPDYEYEFDDKGLLFDGGLPVDEFPI